MAHEIGHARVSTATRDPQLQLDALVAEGCLKIYTDIATGTKADRPKWNLCLEDLRPGDTRADEVTAAVIRPGGRCLSLCEQIPP